MIEATIPIGPGLLAINKAKRCFCPGGKPRSRTTDEHRIASEEFTMKATFAWLGLEMPVYPDGPVILEVDIVPASIHRKGCAKGMANMDDDAPIKAIRDALNGVAYTDDGQIKKTIGEKYTHEERPVGITVRIYRPDEWAEAQRIKWTGGETP